MEKLDLRKELKHLYSPSAKKVELVEVPVFKFLMIDGAIEPATVAKMDAFVAEQGCVKTGKHHEIYLGNPLRAAPSKLKTILRHPVEKASGTGSASAHSSRYGFGGIPSARLMFHPHPTVPD